MAGEDRVLAGGAKHIDFQTDPSRYRHWKLDVDGEVATLTMGVDENGGLFEGYPLKLNSYDLGVDIELADAVQRFVTVINGTAAGGGYELALATDHIILADDGSAAVALPEVPLLAVLPG